MALVVNASAGDVKDLGLIPLLGRSPEGGHDNPLQYSCLENPMDRGALNPPPVPAHWVNPGRLLTLSGLRLPCL